LNFLHLPTNLPFTVSPNYTRFCVTEPLTGVWLPGSLPVLPFYHVLDSFPFLLFDYTTTILCILRCLVLHWIQCLPLLYSAFRFWFPLLISPLFCFYYVVPTFRYFYHFFIVHSTVCWALLPGTFYHYLIRCLLPFSPTCVCILHLPTTVPVQMRSTTLRHFWWYQFCSTLHSFTTHRLPQIPFPEFDLFVHHFINFVLFYVTIIWYVVRRHCSGGNSVYVGSFYTLHVTDIPTLLILPLITTAGIDWTTFYPLHLFSTTIDLFHRRFWYHYCLFVSFLPPFHYLLGAFHHIRFPFIDFSTPTIRSVLRFSMRCSVRNCCCCCSGFIRFSFVTDSDYVLHSTIGILFVCSRWSILLTDFTTWCHSYQSRFFDTYSCPTFPHSTFTRSTHFVPTVSLICCSFCSLIWFCSCSICLLFIHRWFYSFIRCLLLPTHISYTPFCSLYDFWAITITCVSDFRWRYSAITVVLFVTFTLPFLRRYRYRYGWPHRLPIHSATVTTDLPPSHSWSFSFRFRCSLPFRC